MNKETTCRHEYIKIFQRKLKGFERRLVPTRAYLPVGFKTGDLNYLSEGSYCFCTKCRARLFPRRTNAEKLAAKALLAQKNKIEQEETIIMEEVLVERETTQTIAVEELEQETVDVQDIQAEGVKLTEDDQLCQLSDNE